MDPAESALSFETPEQLEQWLRDNHDSAQELWVRLFKKASGVPSVVWQDCVIACLIWGWIDGQRNRVLEAALEDRPEWPEPRKNPNWMFNTVTSGPVTASQAEAARNPRSRSAKLRVAERIGHGS